jgi:hypothetical protein
MMFDAQINVTGLEVTVPEANEDGTMPEGEAIFINMTVATGLPTGQGLIPLPVGRLNIPMPPAIAKQMGEKLLEAAAKYPEAAPKSDILIADEGGMQAAVAQAKMVNKLKGKKK